MSAVAFRIDASGFDRLARQVSAIQAAVPGAIALGLNDGGAKVRTQFQRALKQQTNVLDLKSISKRVQTIKAGPGSLSFILKVTGKGLPIREFPVQLTLRGVDAETWGVDHLFARSFGIPGTSGVGGFRARVGNSRYRIRRLYGPSLPKEVSKGIVPSVFILTAGEFIPPAIMRQLARVM